MKSLYESIISNSKIGIKSTIEKWCIDHNIFDGKFKINADNTITSTYPGAVLRLYYGGYDELPEYIKFESNEYTPVIIGPEKGKSVDMVRKIKSFRGLPSVAHSIRLVLPYSMTELPPLKIKLYHSFSLRALNIRKYNDLDIEFDKTGIAQTNFKLDTEAPLENIHVTGASVIDFVNDGNIGDAFSKAMNRKAEMNKYKNKYTFPVSDAALDIINTFFTGIDMSSVEEIQYTQNSKLVKHDGKWYRCKNW